MALFAVGVAVNSARLPLGLAKCSYATLPHLIRLAAALPFLQIRLRSVILLLGECGKTSTRRCFLALLRKKLVPLCLLPDELSAHLLVVLTSHDV